jgi:hypothetical protein
MPRWVEHQRQAEEAEEESSSEEEEGSDGEQEQEADDGDDADEAVVGVVAAEEVTETLPKSGAGASTSGQRRKITIVLNKKDLVCHVSPSSLDTTYCVYLVARRMSFQIT